MSHEQCKLCQQHLPLRESHIVPRFVIDWMKQGGVGYLRRPIQPNKREQDGPKEHLLCDTCEQKFSAHEKWFAETVFRPYLRDRSIELAYDERLYYVLASILWRCGVVSQTRRTAPPTAWCRVHAQAVTEHLSIWRAYLNGEPSGEVPSVHCFLTDIGTADGVQPVVNFSRYMAHSLDFTVADDGELALVYCKFARFILFSPVAAVDEMLLEGTRISPSGGILQTPQAIRQPDIGQFIVTRARASHELFQARISPRQQEIIHRTAMENAESLMNSDVGSLLAADYSAIVEPPLSKPSRYGRNKPLNQRSSGPPKIENTRNARHCRGYIKVF